MSHHPSSLLLRVAAVVAFALALAPASARGGEIAVGEAYPLRGEPTTLTVTADGAPVAGAVIEVLYRPNSQTSHTTTLPPTAADGSVSWTPDGAGLVTLTARLPGNEAAVATRNVAVRFGAFPASGVGIMILAAVLLFGGAAVGFVLLLQGDEPPPPGEADGPSS